MKKFLRSLRAARLTDRRLAAAWRENRLSAGEAADAELLAGYDHQKFYFERMLRNLVVGGRKLRAA